MSKVTNLGLNLVPSRLPKKTIVETDKAEEIASKIHAVAVEPVVIEPIVQAPEPVVALPVETSPRLKSKAANPPVNKTASTPSVKSIKKRTARTIIEDPDAVRKTSFDFPVSLYRSMKIRLAEDGVSMRDYVIGLIEDDLNSR